MEDIGRFPKPVVCYCATCDEEWALGKKEFLGLEFTCPKESCGEKHLARLVLDERPALWWLRLEWYLYVWQSRIPPGRFLQRALPWAAAPNAQGEIV